MCVLYEMPYGTARAFRWFKNMALKITGGEITEGAVILRLEGKVTGHWVREVERACELALSGAKGLILEMADVAFIDQGGIDLLRSLAARQVQLVGCSPFIALQLDQEHAGDRGCYDDYRRNYRSPGEF